MSKYRAVLESMCDGCINEMRCEFLRTRCNRFNTLAQLIEEYEKEHPTKVTYKDCLDRLYYTNSTVFSTGITRKEAYDKLKELVDKWEQTEEKPLSK